MDDGERSRRRPDLGRGRPRDAGFRRLEEIRSDGDVDSETIAHAGENAERMWHSIGFDSGADGEKERARNAHHAATMNSVKDEILAAARDGISSARAQSGIDPAVVDVVLRRLDARGAQPE